MQDLLTDGNSTLTNYWFFSIAKGCILICLDVKPLGNERAKWLCNRLGGEIEEMNEKLKRIHFMYRSDGSTKLYRAKIDDNGEELLQHAVRKERVTFMYDLVVVEEGHLVFTEGDCE